MNDLALSYRVLLPEDAATLRAFRLAALDESPSAFSGHPDEEGALPLETFRGWIAHADNRYFAAFEGERLIGIVCLTRESRIKVAHKALIRSFYVMPEWRGRGIGKALLQQAIDHARGEPGLWQLLLNVTANNTGARHLYEGLGFVCHGIEPNALQVAGDLHDEAAYSLALPEHARMPGPGARSSAG